MIYFIERETDMPFDNAINECILGKKIYDIVISNKNTGLDRISDHIVDNQSDKFIIIKTNPRDQSLVEKYIIDNFGPISELLLG